MNRIKELFARKEGKILNVYCTAGYPKLDSTVEVVLGLEQAGVDLIELGIPYSDPLADGPTIQQSSQLALDNGMTMQVLFDQLKQIRKQSSIPIILMGYLNQLLQYDMDTFLSTCQENKVDGLIIPDLPLDIYENAYRDKFEKHNIGISFLMTPETSDQRIQKIDDLSKGFVYVVSQSSITGKTADISKRQIEYFERVRNLEFKNPKLIGFGIHDKKSFEEACKYADGAIIGSAFIKAIKNSINVRDDIRNFIAKIL